MYDQILRYCLCIADLLSRPIELSILTFLPSRAGGVIGESLPRFCFFGDTMNLSARMETMGQPGRLQVTAAVAARLAGSATLRVTESARKYVKGKGDVMVHFVDHTSGTCEIDVVVTGHTPPEQRPRSISAELFPRDSAAASGAASGSNGFRVGTATARHPGLSSSGAYFYQDSRSGTHSPPSPLARHNTGAVCASPSVGQGRGSGARSAPFHGFRPSGEHPEGGRKPPHAAPVVSDTLAEFIVAEAGRLRRQASFSRRTPSTEINLLVGGPHPDPASAPSAHQRRVRLPPLEPAREAGPEPAPPSPSAAPPALETPPPDASQQLLWGSFLRAGAASPSVGAPSHPALEAPPPDISQQPEWNSPTRTNFLRAAAAAPAAAETPIQSTDAPGTSASGVPGASNAGRRRLLPRTSASQVLFASYRKEAVGQIWPKSYTSELKRSKKVDAKYL